MVRIHIYIYGLRFGAAHISKRQFDPPDLMPARVQNIEPSFRATILCVCLISITKFTAKNNNKFYRGWMDNSKLLRSSQVKCTALDASRCLGALGDGSVEVRKEVNLAVSIDKVFKRASLQDASELGGLGVLSEFATRSTDDESMSINAA